MTIPVSERLVCAARAVSLACLECLAVIGFSYDCVAKRGVRLERDEAFGTGRVDDREGRCRRICWFVSIETRLVELLAPRLSCRW